MPVRRYRLAVLNSHPSPYLDPIYRALGQHPEVDLTVYYCTRQGVEEFFDPLFGVRRSPDTALLHGYSHRFLPNWRSGLSVGGYARLINPAIVSEIWRERFDALWVHSYNYVTYMVGLATARVRGTALLYRAEHSPTYDSQVRRSIWVSAFKPLLLRALFRQVNCFLAIGTLNAEFYRQYGASPQQIFSVPYTVDNEYFDRKAREIRASRKEIRAALGIGPDDVTFLFAGKLIPQKAPLELLKAYGQVGGSKKALILAGEGGLRPEAEAYVAAKNLQGVHFTGYANQTELAKLYAISDVHVRPDGLYIGDWGLTVNEAMASGLAIIATDALAASVDLVKPGENGVVVRFGDLAALASAMRQMAADPAGCREMGRRSSEIISRWSHHECVQGILAALHSLDADGHL